MHVLFLLGGGFEGSLVVIGSLPHRVCWLPSVLTHAHRGLFRRCCAAVLYLELFVLICPVLVPVIFKNRPQLSYLLLTYLQTPFFFTKARNFICVCTYQKLHWHWPNLFSVKKYLARQKSKTKEKCWQDVLAYSIALIRIYCPVCLKLHCITGCI